MALPQLRTAADFPLASGFNLPSTFIEGQRRLLRHPCTTRKTFFQLSFSAVLISLAIAYLIWGCFRHLSLRSNLDFKQRSLAAGGFDGEGCSHTDSHEDSDSEASETQTSGASGGGDQARNAGRPEGTSSRPEGRFTGLPGGIPPDWGLRRMPEEWCGKVKSALCRLRDLGAMSIGLLKFLSPPEAISFALNMATVAIVEIAGFSYIPDEIQHHRIEAAIPYCDLLLALRSSHLTQEAAAAGELGSRVAGMLEMLDREKQQTGDTPGQVRTVLDIIASLAHLRTRQLLRDIMLRRWLGECHRQVAHRRLLYTRAVFEAASLESGTSSDVQLAELNAVVWQYGVMVGTAAQGYSSTSSATPFETTPAGSEQAAGRIRHSTAAGQPQAQLGPSEEILQARGQEAQEEENSFFVESLKTAYALEKEMLSPSEAAPEHRGLHERLPPRLRRWGTQTPEALGWGPGNMPQEVARQLKILMDRAQQAARSIIRIAAGLSPEQAVSLAIQVASLAVVEIAGTAIASPHIQEHREAAGRACCEMLESLLACERTRGFIKESGSERTMLDLVALLQRVRRQPLARERMQASEYLVVTMQTWRLSNCALATTAKLLRSLERGQGTDGELPTQSGQVQMVLQSIGALFKTRMMQLLANERSRRWLCACHDGLSPNLLYTEEELQQAISAPRQRTGALLYELIKRREDVRRQHTSSQVTVEHPSASHPEATWDATSAQSDIGLSGSARAARPSAHLQQPSPYRPAHRQGPLQQHSSGSALSGPTVHLPGRRSIEHTLQTPRAPRADPRFLGQYRSSSYAVRTTPPQHHLSPPPQAQPTSEAWGLDPSHGRRQAVGPFMRQTSSEEGSSQQGPSQPATPAPTVHLPEIYNQRDPRAYRSALILQTPQAPGAGRHSMLQYPSSSHIVSTTTPQHPLSQHSQTRHIPEGLGFGPSHGPHQAFFPSTRHSPDEQGPFQEHPSQPPSPAPFVQLPEIYHWRDPRVHQSAPPLQSPQALLVQQHPLTQQPSSSPTVRTRIPQVPHPSRYHPSLPPQPHIPPGALSLDPSEGPHQALTQVRQPSDESGGSPGHEAYSVFVDGAAGQQHLVAGSAGTSDLAQQLSTWNIFEEEEDHQED
ncbi:hypothetical protein Efla_001609 [Eimeria flavescens]